MSEPDLRLDSFAPLIGDAFVADLGDGDTLMLTLEEAAERSTGNDHDSAFSLIFRGPTDRVFAQGTVRLMHEGLGSMDLFLVAVGEQDSGRQYEAVFTRTTT